MLRLVEEIFFDLKSRLRYRATAMNAKEKTPENVPPDHAAVQWVSASLDSQHPADMADELEKLSLEEQFEYIWEMDVEDASESAHA